LSKTSACPRPARPSLRIFNAVGASSAREYCSLTPGYFFSNASWRGRTIWLTMRVVYHTTCPSLRAASTRAASAAHAGSAPARWNANATANGGQTLPPPISALTISSIGSSLVPWTSAGFVACLLGRFLFGGLRRGALEVLQSRPIAFLVEELCHP